MDARHFDTLARALSEAGSRRGLLGLLATLPVLGGLVALLDPDDAEAKGRRKRRKKRHKHGKGRRRKHHKKQCKPNSTAKTCAGKCGKVKNNCKKTVDCGSCACDPPCAACFTCQDGPNTPGVCVVDPAQVGDACGAAGQLCQSDGACACSAEPNSCPVCTTCGADGSCQGCADCCDSNGACQDGETNAACGSSGTCDICTGQDECQDQTCVCVPDCDGKSCGDDGCDDSCGTCGSGEACLSDNCAPVRYAFISSTWGNANLGGLSGADTTCTALAGQAGLPGSYKAWLSDDTGSPATRFTQSTIPYVLVDGSVVANNWAGLTSGALLHAINLTETGGFFHTGVWSNTKPDGTLVNSSRDCDNWSNGSFGPFGGIGNSIITNGGWTRFIDSVTCSAGTEAIYCFQQG